MDPTPLIAIALVVAGLTTTAVVLAKAVRQHNRMWAVLHAWQAEAAEASAGGPLIYNPRFNFYGSLNDNGTVAEPHAVVSVDGGVNWRDVTQRE